MPYVSHEFLQAMQDFYTNPTDLNLAKFQMNLKYTASRLKTVDNSLLRLQIDSFSYLQNQKEKKKAEEEKYKQELERRYADYEKQLAEQLEQKAAKLAEETIGKAFQDCGGK